MYAKRDGIVLLSFSLLRVVLSLAMISIDDIQWNQMCESQKHVQT